MGIAVSHGEASWSYSGFMTFRTRIANTCGLPGDLSDAYHNGSYKFLINDPIYALIDHSDCDGGFSVEEMKIIVPRLKEIIAQWSDGVYSGYDIMNGKALIEGMEKAISLNEELEFH